MFEIILSLLLGVFIGLILKYKKSIYLKKSVFWLVLILIFSIGYNIGANNELINFFPKIGLQAVILCILSVVFSVILVKVTLKLVKI